MPNKKYSKKLKTEEGIFMENKGVVEKVDYLMKKAICKDYDDNDIELIVSYLDEHSEHAILGRVFGYSVSEYAFAALKWIGTEQTVSIFEKYYNKLSKERKKKINELIQSEYYLQY